jgi:SAM-dependent methyltransferase
MKAVHSNAAGFWKGLHYVLWPPAFGFRTLLRPYLDRWRFWREYRNYCRLLPGQVVPEAQYFLPCMSDATDITPIEPGYYFQDAWAFEKIAHAHPTLHVDIGSHHKFVALLSKIVPTTMVDLRPLPLKLDSLSFKRGSILALPFESGTIPSVSSLCVIEHIGLGRYGDPLDPVGTEAAAAELKRIVQPGGDLYISVPIDDANRTYFNAHRAFVEPYVLELFSPFEVIERRYIFGQEFTDALRPGFGTGCYHFRRPTIQPAAALATAAL